MKNITQEINDIARDFGIGICDTEYLPGYENAIRNTEWRIDDIICPFHYRISSLIEDKIDNEYDEYPC